VIFCVACALVVPRSHQLTSYDSCTILCDINQKFCVFDKGTMVFCLAV